jgi:hypothetical protein
VIVFTDRELRRAWSENFRAFQQGAPKTNAHRLLLFYSVECGLKSLVLRHRNLTLSNLVPEFPYILHDINKLLDTVRAGASLRIKPEPVLLQDIAIKGKSASRNAACRHLNQVWRYGALAVTLSDSDLEKKLLEIHNWLQAQL